LVSRDREETLLFGLREDEKMGESYGDSATPSTERRTTRMILIISIGLVFALTVGGFVVAANNLGNQDQDPVIDVQEIDLDYFDSAEIAQSLFLREPSFVMESESGNWGPLCTEQGYIEFAGEYLPDVLPLCITNEFLADWYVDVLVYGGYKPWEMGSYIDVWQKGDYQGRICVVWTHIADGPCCAYDYYRATFYVMEDICLESNQYPDVYPWDINFPDGQDTIPGKCVMFEIMTYWTGCVPGEEPSQDFTIIHSHSQRAFSKWFILTLQTKHPTIQDNPNHTSQPARSI
jgi:hypothetical protein